MQKNCQKDEIIINYHRFPIADQNLCLKIKALKIGNFKFMANRHLSRSLVMQSLYERDFNKADKSQMKEILERNIRKFAPGLEDSDFAHRLSEGVLKNQEIIDAIIEKVFGFLV